MKYFNFTGEINGTQYALRWGLSVLILVISVVFGMEESNGDDYTFLIVAIPAFILLISTQIKRYRSVFNIHPWAVFGIVGLVNMLVQGILPEAIGEVPGVLFMIFLIFVNNKNHGK